MTEESFAATLIGELGPYVAPHRVEAKRALLYDLSVDHRGVVAMGVDPDTGEPIRGRGRGFEQDLLVFKEVAGTDTSVVLLIVAELKFGSVTTLDAIVYSEKADRIRRVYPYIRYGFVLGGMRHIPGRVLRLGQRFDFIVAISPEMRSDEMESFFALMREEAAASEELTDVLFENRKASVLRKRLVVSP